MRADPDQNLLTFAILDGRPSTMVTVRRHFSQVYGACVT